MSKTTISELEAVKMLEKLLNKKVWEPERFAKAFKMFSEGFGWFDAEGNAATPFVQMIVEAGKAPSTPEAA
jgi:hypothetical protein